jgi:hypothetical protein
MAENATLSRRERFSLAAMSSSLLEHFSFSLWHWIWATFS